MDWQNRTQLLIEESGVRALLNSHVMLVGLGGVGAYAAECLCRAGIGELTLIDGDIVSKSNINRQLPALQSTIGKPKADVLRERFFNINPNVKINVIQKMLNPDDIDNILGDNSINYDFIVDAIDTLSAKTHLCIKAKELNIPIVCSMGAGNRLDPSKIIITDISKTHTDGLASAFRKRLKSKGIKKGVDVVFSSEVPIKLFNMNNKERIVGSISYIPAIFGCTIAGFVINKLLKKK